MLRRSSEPSHRVQGMPLPPLQGTVCPSILGGGRFNARSFPTDYGCTRGAPMVDTLVDINRVNLPGIRAALGRLAEAAHEHKRRFDMVTGGVSVKRFAAMCMVGTRAMQKAVAAGRVRARAGLVDPSDPRNRAYRVATLSKQLPKKILGVLLEGAPEALRKAWTEGNGEEGPGDEQA